MSDPKCMPGCPACEAYNATPPPSDHKVTHPPVHDWDCAPCEALAVDRAARSGKNPHRPGTKAAARWDRDERAARWACDPRTETYWSL